jgi:hypothetical protein
MFAPAPQFQTMPVNITSRFDIDGVDISHLPTYPTIDARPYDLKELQWTDSLGKYSASSHGMRVQLLLEHVHQFAPGLDIFIAHLACNYQGTKDGVGIYLFSDQPRQYRRVCPNTLVKIDPTYYTTETELVLEDVYIIHTDSLLQSGGASIPNNRLFGFRGEFQVNLIDEELSKAGYKLKDTSECKKSTTRPKKGTLLTFEDPKWWYGEEKRHILLFEPVERPIPEDKKSSIAVIWEIKDRTFQVGVEVEVDRLAKPSGLHARYYYLPMTVYRLSDKLKFHSSRATTEGKGVIVAFRQTGGKIILNVVIF